MHLGVIVQWIPEKSVKKLKRSMRRGSYALKNKDCAKEIERIRKEQEKAYGSSGKTEDHYPFLYIGLVCDGSERGCKNNNQNEIGSVTNFFLGECRISAKKKPAFLYFKTKAKDNQHKGDLMTYTITSNDLIIKDLKSFLNFKLSSRTNKNGYIQLERSQKAIEKVSFYLRQAKPNMQKKNKGARPENHSAAKAKDLSKYKQRGKYAERPYKDPAEHETRARGKFQTDYERIIHTKAFRRLVDKAQVFSSSKGDHYRTRMTHTFEVSQIARALAKAFKLNVTLTEAIALAHDIGHTPFGHQGERTLDNILKGRTLVELNLYDPKRKPYNLCKCDSYGGFKHNFQALRTLSSLEEDHLFFKGINPSAQLLEGVLWHTKTPRIEHCFKDCSENKNGCCRAKSFRPAPGTKAKRFWNYVFHEKEFEFDDHPLTLEGQVVAIADEIAQRSHDIDDALSSNIMTFNELQDVSLIRSIDDLNASLESISTDIENGECSDYDFFDPGGVKRARAASAIVYTLIQSVLKGSTTDLEELAHHKKQALTLHKNDKLFKLDETFGYIASEQVIIFDSTGQNICDYLEQVVKSSVLNSSEISRFDNIGERVIKGLFKAYYSNPLILPKSVLNRIAFKEKLFHCPNPINLGCCNNEVAQEEIKRIHAAYVPWQKDPFDDLGANMKDENEYSFKKMLLVRAIVDYIAGMTDSFALNEYEKLCV